MPLTVDATIAADFAQMGVSVEIDPDKKGAFQVWDVNWDSLCCFLDCESQWRVAVGLAGGQLLGLDYSAVDVVLRRRQVADGVFDDLQVMERAALAAMGEN